MISAKRKDGTPAQEGDRVFVVWESGRKSSGRIKKVTGIQSFMYLKHAMLQTYMIRCDDKSIRPAHARHIKIVYQKRRRS